ncbi:GntR family transcriptional regulator [Maritimibacter dapengensis]|uniref:GntR family transcriptional regulator n=1 Tax=Maritimibacter dapengensis TaxID=2836868 RepID=UPI00300D35D7
MSDRGNTNAKRAAYDLRQRIIKGELPGGTRLFEVALAEELDVSRTPVREAMSRLAEEGLLERAQSGGFVVRSFTHADVVDAIELRGVLEGTAVRLAAEAGVSDEQISHVNELVGRIDACFAVSGQPDLDLYSELNAAFHDELSRLCPSPIVQSELERVKSLPFASPSAFVFRQRDRDGMIQSLILAQAQHRAMIEAIAGREGARAEALAREHARIARRNLEAKALGADFAHPAMALVVE